MASRRTFSSEFKARVVREALKEQETTSELARRFEVAASQMYLVAIIDWYSRKIVAWRLSNSLEASESKLCLQKTIQTHGKPDIVNSDQGNQYTCAQWIDYLKAQHIRINMDGRGRAKDNGLKLYQYINYYNERRYH